MPTIVFQLEQAFRAAIAKAFGFEADPVITVSQNEKFGDYQSNAAMGLAKSISEGTGQKSNPRQVAEQIRHALDLDGIASEVSIAGPGFINVRLSPQWLAGRIEAIVGDPRLGIEPAPDPQTVVVDYSGPNVAKEMHVGHLRSTIIGDAISRLLEFHGDKVLRRNHVGDWGTQFGMLIAYLKDLQGHGTQGAGIQGGHIADLEGFYRQAKQRFDEDPQFQDASRETVVRLQRGESDERAAWQKIVDETRRSYEPIYGRLNVKLTREHEFGESYYNPLLPKVVEDLKRAGIAEESEGAVAVFVDGRDKSPLLIQKTGGGYLYGTTDLAAVRQRIEELGATRLIYTHDSRQAQHFRQVFETARRAGWAAPSVSLEYAPFGTMLGADGKPFKTRSGGTVKLAELLDEAEERAFALVTEKSPDMPESQRRAIARAVGIGAVKYADLVKDRTSDYVFSFDQMISLDGNTGPYLQYAYARIRSVFRKAGIDDASTIAGAVQLHEPQELSLARHVLRLGEIVDLVARELKPHHLCNYLYELATRLSAFYESCPVLQSQEPTRSSRLILLDVIARTLALGLDLLGIEHPEQM